MLSNNRFMVGLSKLIALFMFLLNNNKVVCELCCKHHCIWLMIYVVVCWWNSNFSITSLHIVRFHCVHQSFQALIKILSVVEISSEAALIVSYDVDKVCMVLRAHIEWLNEEQEIIGWFEMADSWCLHEQGWPYLLEMLISLLLFNGRSDIRDDGRWYFLWVLCCLGLASDVSLIWYPRRASKDHCWKLYGAYNITFLLSLAGGAF